MLIPRRFIRFGLMAAAVVALAAATFPLVAQEERKFPGAAPPVPLVTLHRPTSVPDRIILTWEDDPATTQSVTWRTDTQVTAGVAQIAEAEAGPLFVRKAKTVPAETTPFTSDLGPAHYHTARFTGLQPSTRYVYRVGDGVNWSEWIHFLTASTEPEPFSFVYFGDAQNDLKSMWSRVIREAYSDAPKARFIIHAGDLINTSTRDGEWGEWHGAGGWVNAMVPSIPTPGNHEYGRGPDGQRRLAPHWRPQFALPRNGPPGLEETVYSIDYQGVRIISLNSNERQQDQVAWLEEQLRENPNRWTVVTFHHPVFSTARGRDNKALREAWMPVFDRYRVDLVLNGHDHGYGRSNLNTGLNFRENKSGTVYVVSVSGPKMYNVEKAPWMERAAEDTQLYQVVSVNGGRLKYEARTATGELYDAFDLRKIDGQANRLIERRSKRIAERLRAASPTAAASESGASRPRASQPRP
jgi:3',5'-cyclic AMP phosphodiesterase CpdA